MIDWDIVGPKAEIVANALDADVLVYNGDIERGYDHTLINLCHSRKNKRKNVLLVLTTSGGDPHAAYRIARCLQSNYEKFIVYVPGWCKSAGTLVAIGAHELFVGPCGELGPLDVQRGKQDELREPSSGLTEDAALETLEKTAFKMFRDYLFSIKAISRGQVTFSTAADVAAKFVIGQLEPVYAQIDPAKIGENTRAMNIAIDYGLRLNLHSGSLKNRRSLNKLASAYSSHGFVIDKKEAEELFSVVMDPSDVLEDLCLSMGEDAHFPIEDDENEAVIRFANEELKNEEIQQPDKSSAESAEHVRADFGGAIGSAADISGEVVPLRTGRSEAEGST